MSADQAATLARAAVAEQGAQRQTYAGQAAAARRMRETAERRRSDPAALQGSATAIRDAVARSAERAQRIAETERAVAERGAMLAVATERARVADADAGGCYSRSRRGATTNGSPCRRSGARGRRDGTGGASRADDGPCRADSGAAAP